MILLKVCAFLVRVVWILCAVSKSYSTGDTKVLLDSGKSTEIKLLGHHPEHFLKHGIPWALTEPERGGGKELRN